MMRSESLEQTMAAGLVEPTDWDWDWDGPSTYSHRLFLERQRVPVEG